MYGYSLEKGEFYPELNFTVSYDMESDCVYLKTLLSFRTDYITEYMQCNGIETYVTPQVG